MAAGSTYTPIATTTLGSAQATVSFNSFSGYTDIYAVCAPLFGSTSNFQINFNSDSGSNYSNTLMLGDGSSAISARQSNQTRIVAGYNGTSSSQKPMYQISLMNYANTSTYKTALIRASNAGSEALAQVGLWRSTSAITSIQFAMQNGDNFQTGSTFTLYGIAAA